MAVVHEWNELEFEQAIASGVTMVDFFATWCGPCKMMMSVLEKAVEPFDEAVLKVGKINVDQCRDLAVKYNIRTIPTFMIFKDGELKDVIIGIQSQKALAKAIEAVL